MDPLLSHLLYGAVGGVLYVLVRLTKGRSVRPVEWIARPAVGAVMAHVLTTVMGLPNSTTSLFVGYFGIDLFIAATERAKRMIEARGVKIEEQ